MLKKQATSPVFKYSLSFDDVLLIPKYSDISTRAEVDISSSMGSYDFCLPIISSPMDTVTESDMAVTMANEGGLGVIHRYGTIAWQRKEAEKALKAVESSRVAVAVGASGDFEERVVANYESGVRIFCVDVAHGHHSLVEAALKTLKDKYAEDITIIAGNVAVDPGYVDLASWGADAVRVGIGGGSICSTRIQTGHGVPTFQSVSACSIAKKMIAADQREAPQGYRDVPIIADGGIKYAGDIVKALAAGADFAMLGSMLAGTSDTPGDVLIDASGAKHKIYRGMASVEAQVAWRGEARSREGVSTTVEYKGPTSEQLSTFRQNIKSGLSYSGARNIKEFRKRSEFVIQTSAGLAESRTHITDRK